MLSLELAVKTDDTEKDTLSLLQILVSVLKIVNDKTPKCINTL